MRVHSDAIVCALVHACTAARVEVHTRASTTHACHRSSNVEPQESTICTTSSGESDESVVKNMRSCYHCACVRGGEYFASDGLEQHV